MAGNNRGPDWLIRTGNGKVPRAIAPKEVRRRIEEEHVFIGKPLLAEYFDTPYFVVRSWNRKGRPDSMVLPCVFTPSGRARFLIDDVKALAVKRKKFLDNIEIELGHLRNREVDRIRAALNAPGAAAAGVGRGTR